MNPDDTPARVPASVSITDLMMSGMLCEDDVRLDGTVNEVSRAIAEQEYLRHVASLPRRPQSAPPRPASRTNRKATVRDGQECCICLSKRRTHAISPCFHYCVCEGCVSQIEKCPLCRVVISSVHRIFAV